MTYCIGGTEVTRCSESYTVKSTICLFNSEVWLPSTPKLASPPVTYFPLHTCCIWGDEEGRLGKGVGLQHQWWHCGLCGLNFRRNSKSTQKARNRLWRTLSKMMRPVRTVDLKFKNRYKKKCVQTEGNCFTWPPQFPAAVIPLLE